MRSGAMIFGIIGLMMLSACAAPGQSLPLGCGRADLSAAVLDAAAKACLGDTAAYLTLAKALEQGGWVAQNLPAAETYYEAILDRVRTADTGAVTAVTYLFAAETYASEPPEAPAARVCWKQRV